MSYFSSLDPSAKIWAVIAIAVIFAIGTGIWWAGCKVNYSLQYESMVRATVKEMVRHEALQ